MLNCRRSRWLLSRSSKSFQRAQWFAVPGWGISSTLHQGAGAGAEEDAPALDAARRRDVPAPAPGLRARAPTPKPSASKQPRRQPPNTASINFKQRARERLLRSVRSLRSRRHKHPVKVRPRKRRC